MFDPPLVHLYFFNHASQSMVFCSYLYLSCLLYNLAVYMVLQCFMAAMSIAMMAWIFMARYFNWNPDVQDPYKMTALLLCSLIPVGFGFMITEEDQGEAPHG